jgi:hypothetical protein
LLCAKKFITLIVIVVAQLVSLSLFLLLLMLLQFAETFAEATPRRGVLYYAATFIIMMEKEAKSGKKRFTIMQYLGTFVTLYSRVKAFPTRGYCVFINCALTHGEPNDETPVRRAISEIPRDGDRQREAKNRETRRTFRNGAPLLLDRSLYHIAR